MSAEVGERLRRDCAFHAIGRCILHPFVKRAEQNRTELLNDTQARLGARSDA